jgi:hypothetical protein
MDETAIIQGITPLLSNKHCPKKEAMPGDIA